MSKRIFISYSRREIGFVDALVDQLESKGNQVWLDYRSLIPGTPWLDQIHRGIEEADVLLLVVSKASLASQNVEVEWKSVLQQKKRIILLVFEAVDLPNELEKYEWVDFRGSFQRGLNELFSQMEKPVNENHPVPQTGFKMPGIVWVAFLLSVVVAILSLPAIWTLLIPWVLIPLPYRILKRNYNFTYVQAALFFLPIALFSGTIINDNINAAEFDVIMANTVLGFPLAIILLFVLRSSGMQRWGKEEATLPRFANPYTPDNPRPSPVPFYIDHAPQDARIAEMLENTLEDYGHPVVKQMQDARAVFVMLSRFKKDSEADPEKQVVFPVIVQTSEDISPKLAKVQWIDMRSGVRGLDAIAQLLPEPEKLLKALGNRPRGRMLVLPAPVAAMQFFLTLLGVFAMGCFFKLFVELINNDVFNLPNGDSFMVLVFFFIADLVLVGWLLVTMLRNLIQREGGLASFRAFTRALGGVGFLAFLQTALGIMLDSSFADIFGEDSPIIGIVSIFPTFIFLVGGVVMAVFLLVRYKDIRAWFPVSK